jgi:hypothetical protein
LISRLLLWEATVSRSERGGLVTEKDWLRRLLGGMEELRLPQKKLMVERDGWSDG